MTKEEIRAKNIAAFEKFKKENPDWRTSSMRKTFEDLINNPEEPGDYTRIANFDIFTDMDMQRLFWKKRNGRSLTSEEEKQLEDYIDKRYQDAYEWDPEWFDEHYPEEDALSREAKDHEEVRRLYALYNSTKKLTQEEEDEYQRLVNKWGSPADDDSEGWNIDDDEDYEDYEDEDIDDDINDDIDGDYEDDVPEYMYDPYTGSSWYESNNSWKDSNILTRM